VHSLCIPVLGPFPLPVASLSVPVPGTFPLPVASLCVPGPESTPGVEAVPGPSGTPGDSTLAAVTCTRSWKGLLLLRSLYVWLCSL